MTTTVDKDSAMHRNIWIDTDAGIDDAHAILMALADPTVTVIGISTIRGNTSSSQGVCNVLRLLRVSNCMQVPVYKGCEKLLLDSQPEASFYHGLDGFGDVLDPDPVNPNLVQPEHAVNALIDTVNKHPSEVMLVCLGPLTNIAMAIRLDPEFGKKLKDCSIMGGNYQGRGNVTTAAEFNFYSDPEAAYVVINELHAPITMTCWELCLNNSLSLEWYTEAFSNISSSKGCFIKAINTKCMSTYYQNRPLPDTDYEVADQLMMAICLDPKVVEATKAAYCTVELLGAQTRGQMICDWAHRTGRVPNVTIVTAVDTDLLKRIMIDAL